MLDTFVGVKILSLSLSLLVLKYTLSLSPIKIISHLIFSYVQFDYNFLLQVYNRSTQTIFYILKLHNLKHC